MVHKPLTGKVGLDVGRAPFPTSRLPALCGIRRFDAEAVPGAWKGLKYIIQLPPAQSQKRI